MFAIPITRTISLSASFLRPVIMFAPAPTLSGEDASALSSNRRSPTWKSPIVGCVIGRK